MHTNFKIYYFIEKFNLKDLSKINRSINIIFRNYKKNDFSDDLIKLRNLCRKRGHSIYLSNNIKLASKLKLDGVYLPFFNKRLIYKNLNLRKKFKIIGSAHNIAEIKIKEMQNVSKIFISSLFKKNKNFLGMNKFKLISNSTKKKVVALGGISKKNINKLSLLNNNEFAGISFFE